VGRPPEPDEAERGEADAREDDPTVHEGLEVLASVEPLRGYARKQHTEEPTNAAPAARAPPTIRTPPRIKEPTTH
jgi:hypothetical protein